MHSIKAFRKLLLPFLVAITSMTINDKKFSCPRLALLVSQLRVPLMLGLLLSSPLLLAQSTNPAIMASPKPKAPPAMENGLSMMTNAPNRRSLHPGKLSVRVPRHHQMRRCYLMARDWPNGKMRRAAMQLGKQMQIMWRPFLPEKLWGEAFAHEASGRISNSMSSGRLPTLQQGPDRAVGTVGS